MPVRIIAEVAFGYSITSASPTWTDITQYVDLAAGININRGAADELSQTQPGTMTLTLDNSDGRFTPTRTGSSYYPNVKKNVPMRLRTVTADKNLITNPSFESGLTDWTASATPTIAQSSTHVQHGSQAMLLTFGGGVSGQSASTTVHGLDIGATYTVSAYVWVPTGDTHVHLRVLGGPDSSPSTVNDAFQRITLTFTATATQHSLLVRSATTPAAGDQVWIDAVQLEEGASATTFASDGAQVHARFFGMVNEWPLEWTGLQAKTVISCTDIFKWARLEDTLQPMLNQEILLDRPAAYYPLSEPADSTSAGDVSGTTGIGALSIVQAGSGGTLTFDSGTGPADSLGCPTFTPAASNAGKYLTADLGQTFQDANTNFRLRLEAWFTTSTSGRVLMALTSTDLAVKVIILLESGTGKLALEKDQIGNGVTTTVVNTPNLADGNLHHLAYSEAANEVVVDGVTYTAVANNQADLRTLTVGGYANNRLWSGTIAHLALYVRSITPTELASHYTTGTTEHIGETADARLSRLASYVGLTVTTQGTVFDAMASQKALGKSALEHMREIETTESGKLLASRSSAALLFQSRSLRYNPVAAVSLAYADLETDSVRYADDDQKMVNAVIATRAGGATQRVINQTAIDTYGPKPRELELFKNTDLKVTDAATWLVSRYADPPPEVRQVPVEAYSMPITTYRALLDADVSTVLGLTGLPDQAPASTATVVVEGYSERIGLGTHLIDFHTSRADTDTVWVLDDATYSVLDSTTRLAY